MSNIPSTHERPNLLEWLRIWWRALTKPTPAGYRELFGDVQPQRTTALAWLVTGGLVAAIINMLTYSAPFVIVALVLVFALLFFTLAYVIVTVITARSALWIGTQIRGEPYDALVQGRMLYALAAINAPLSILSALVYLIPNGYLLAYVLAVYWVYLTVLAVKVLCDLGWGQALMASIVFILISVLVVALGVGVALLP